MILYIICLIIGLSLLTWGADRFVLGSSQIAKATHVSPFIIGMVIIGFGTSTPEFLVSITAALEGSPNIALGNAIGSNITNIALVLGLSACLAVLPLSTHIMKQEIPIMLATGLLVSYFLWDLHFSRIEGFICLILLSALLYRLVRRAKSLPQAQQHALEEVDLDDIPTEDKASAYLTKAILLTLGSLILLLLSSKLLIWSAASIASALGVSELIIGLTIIAIGTSLPELAASISSIRQGETEFAVGNIIGSNLFNTLGVIGFAGLFAPFDLSNIVIYRDLPIMLGLVLAVLILAKLPPQRNAIGLLAGLIFLASFIAYQCLLFYHTYY